VRLNNQLFVLLLNGHLQLTHNLIGDEVDMGPSFGRTDAIHEGHLLELSIAETGHDLPPIIFLLNNFWKVSILLIFKIQIAVVDKVLNFDPFSIELDSNSGIGDPCQIIGSLGQQAHRVWIHILHFELSQVWIKCDTGEVQVLVIWSDHWLLLLTHVVLEHLTVHLSSFRVCCLNYEFGAEDVGQFGSVPIAAPCHLLLLIVVV
jgi:hypothetical protein